MVGGVVLDQTFEPDGVVLHSFERTFVWVKPEEEWCVAEGREMAQGRGEEKRTRSEFVGFGACTMVDVHCPTRAWISA